MMKIKSIGNTLNMRSEYERKYNMPTYYTDRASYDAAYRAKQNKRRKIVLICVLAAIIWIF